MPVYYIDRRLHFTGGGTPHFLTFIFLIIKNDLGCKSLISHTGLMERIPSEMLQGKNVIAETSN